MPDSAFGPNLKLESGVRLWGILRCYGHDAAALGPVLESVRRQARQLDGLIVVDGDPRRLVSQTEIEERLAPGANVSVLSLGANVGPAGSSQAAISHLQPKLDDEDWILIFDDDEPLPGDDYLHRLLEIAVSLKSVDPKVGGVGRVGHRFSYETGRLVRPKPAEICGLVPVDYLSTNHAPVFRAAALRLVGGYRADLFVGHTEVDLGLRLRRAGHTIYAAAELWNPAIGLAPNWRGVTTAVVRPNWRRYYSVRNLIVILVEAGYPAAAARVTARTITKALIDTVTRGRGGFEGLQYTCKGIADGWRGRTGARVLPPVPSGDTRRGEVRAGGASEHLEVTH